jgi:hypothetical protein
MVLCCLCGCVEVVKFEVTISWLVLAEALYEISIWDSNYGTWMLIVI